MPQATCSPTTKTRSPSTSRARATRWSYRVGDVLDIFSRAAHAPKMNLFINAALLGFIPKSVKKGLMAVAPVRR